MIFPNISKNVAYFSGSARALQFMPINSRIYCFVSFKYNHEGASNGVWTNSKIKIRTSSKMSALINMHETLQIQFKVGYLLLKCFQK